MSIEIGEPPVVAEEDSIKLSDFVRAEFVKLARLFNTGQDELRLVELHVEPTRPRDGMVVYADGTNWNPGSGEGVYAREAAAWVKL